MNKLKIKAFVVHGHNELARLELCELLNNEFGLETIVLKNKPALGNTIIENFEKLTSDCEVAIVLLTGDDIAFDNSRPTLRSRQNVIFELGYLCALLGRERVCFVYQENVELPSDLQGILYYPFRESVREVAFELRKHLEELDLLSKKDVESVIHEYRLKSK